MRCEQCGTETAGRLCPACSTKLSELPIPASFFSPEESAGRHTFTLPEDAPGQGGFTITASALHIEAVSPESPENPPAAPQTHTAPKPSPAVPKAQPDAAASQQRTSSAAPSAARSPRRPEPQRAVSSEPVPNAEGFYMVPYDESLWATLSRIRHRWLLPVLVGVIFVAGMTTGIVMARSAAGQKEQSSAESEPAETTAPVQEEDLLMTETKLVFYFDTELLPEYGYVPVETALAAAQTDGILSVYASGALMTVVRLESGSMYVESYRNENGEIRQNGDAEQTELLRELNAKAELIVTGDANGIYLGSTRISETGLGTAENAAPVTLCICRCTAEGTYLFTDYTDIRANAPEQTADWQQCYAGLLRDTLRTLTDADTASFRLLDLDGDDVPELELHLEHTADYLTVAQLYTVADGALRLLTTESAATEYRCVPGENCFRESADAPEGTYFYWYHLEDGAAVRDHTEWFGTVDEELVYIVDGETYPAAAYAAQHLPDADRLESNVQYTALTEDAIGSLGS